MTILGIDGGGSKTCAVIGDEDGRILSRGLSGASNYQSVGADASFAALDEAVGRACEAARVEPAAIAAVCLGMAGASRQDDRRVFETWAATRLPSARFRLVSDAHLLLAAGTPSGWGLALISGTGSLAYALDEHGRSHRAGGWGYLLGDEGSGYAIGLAALRAIVAARDGRGPVTALTRAVLDHWGLEEEGGLVGKVYRPPLPPTEIASLATLVDAAARDGDPVAISILAAAGKELAALAAAAIRPLDFGDAIPTAVAGSVVTSSAIVSEALISAAVSAGLRLKPISSVTEPVLGAVRLASELLHQGSGPNSP